MIGKEKVQPLVSVIVPSYNHEKYIEQCINSIINQTYPNVELIVIDDGSRDNSRPLLKKLSALHKFKYVEQENRGVSATLNRGITEFASGKYIACVASDDWWELDKLATQVEFYENNPQMGFVFGNARIVDDSGIGNKMVINEQDLKLSFERLLVKNMVTALTVMVKKDVFDVIGKFDEKLAIEDWDMWLRIADKYPFAYINRCQANYRMHNMNHYSNHLKMLEQEKIIVDKWKGRTGYIAACDNLNLKEISIWVSLNKRTAIKLLIEHKRLFFNLVYLKSLVRLIYDFK
jgi:alpha-1,3-rhamnosyltransferase